MTVEFKVEVFAHVSIDSNDFKKKDVIDILKSVTNVSDLFEFGDPQIIDPDDIFDCDIVKDSIILMNDEGTTLWKSKGKTNKK